MKIRWNKVKEIIFQLKGLTTIGGADGLGSVISALFWFYMASVLGAKNYGEISYLLAIASIASSISLLGTQNTLTVYSAKNLKIQSPLYFITLISGLITSLVLYLIFENVGISTYAFGAVIMGLAIADILGTKMYKSYAKFLIGQKILMVVLAISLFYTIGIQGIILGIGLSFSPYVIRIYQGFRESKMEFSLLRSKFGFFMNSYVLSLIGTANGSIDRMIIAPILGFSLLGNYQLGLQFIGILEILPSIVFKYVLPHDASGNPNRKLKLITIFVSFCLTITGVSFSPYVIPILFPKFTEAITILQIMSLVLVPNSINLMFMSKFLGNERVKIVMISSGLYLSIFVLLILILGKYFGINGVASAFVVATSLQTGFLFVINKFQNRANI